MASSSQTVNVLPGWVAVIHPKKYHDLHHETLGLEFLDVFSFWWIAGFTKKKYHEDHGHFLRQFRRMGQFHFAGKSSSLGKAIWKFWEINRIFWALELDRIGLEQLFLKNFELQERSVKCHWEDLIHEQKTKCWWINKRGRVNCFIRNY